MARPHVPHGKSESLAPRHDRCQVSLKKRRRNSSLYKGPAPQLFSPQGPIGATLGTHMNKFDSSLIKVSTHKISGLLHVWIWRRRFLKFIVFFIWGALPMGPHRGHRYHMNKFAAPTHKDDFYQVWLKLDAPVWRRR